MITKNDAANLVGQTVSFMYKGSKDAEARQRRVLVVMTLFDHGQHDGIRAKDLRESPEKFPKKFLLQNIEWL
tara:strand:- start:3791 stop:4006 length:216 start_codon:yes stop_codon:yes gene_type:complete